MTGSGGPSSARRTGYRATAGLLLFVTARRHRGAYQTLFARRKVTKTYEALSRYEPAVELPTTVRSRIVKERGVLAAQEVAGTPNSETTIELAQRRGGLGKYLLRPGDRTAPTSSACT